MESATSGYFNLLRFRGGARCKHLGLRPNLGGHTPQWRYFSHLPWCTVHTGCSSTGRWCLLSLNVARSSPLCFPPPGRSDSLAFNIHSRGGFISYSICAYALWFCLYLNQAALLLFSMCSLSLPLSYCIPVTSARTGRAQTHLAHSYEKHQLFDVFLFPFFLP